jgi:hypothetical protein
MQLELLGRRPIGQFSPAVVFDAPYAAPQRSSCTPPDGALKLETLTLLSVPSKPSLRKPGSPLLPYLDAAGLSIYSGSAHGLTPAQHEHIVLLAPCTAERAVTSGSSGQQ